MKVFAGILIGAAMATSMFYECFGIFVLMSLAGLILWLSTQNQLMENDDYSSKKSASARQH